MRPFLGDVFTIPANIEKTFDQITKAAGHVYSSGAFPILILPLVLIVMAAVGITLFFALSPRGIPARGPSSTGSPASQLPQRACTAAENPRLPMPTASSR